MDVLQTICSYEESKHIQPNRIILSCFFQIQDYIEILILNSLKIFCRCLKKPQDKCKKQSQQFNQQPEISASFMHVRMIYRSRSHHWYRLDKKWCFHGLPEHQTFCQTLFLSFQFSFQTHQIMMVCYQYYCFLT